ncbi:hypothetical protein AgCh_037880 [Apium graveolens]
MSDNKYKSSLSVPSNSKEKLLRDTQLSKGSKASSNKASDTKSVSEISELQLPSMERLGPGTFPAEIYPEGYSSSHTCSNESKKPQEGMALKPRLLVVSNRLPYSAVRIEDSWSLDISAGGPVTALLGKFYTDASLFIFIYLAVPVRRIFSVYNRLKEFEVSYVGWAGIHVSDEAERKSLTEVLTEKSCLPVFIDEVIFHQYYNGYCNSILWPLFHYLGSSQEDGPATTRSYQSQFDAYKKANQIFADVVIKHYKEGDVVWCHDYHLMFLPKYLKEHNSQLKVGWFLHTPFPPTEVHRTLLSRSELLHALLFADLLGFHTVEYVRHFVSTCTRILGVEASLAGIEYQGRLTRVAVFPMGIDSDRFFQALETPIVRECIKEFTEEFSGRKVILGVDRLDLVKGILQKILAFEKFLEDNKDLRDKVVLLQIAVPRTTDIPEYQKLASKVHKLVGRINGRFGTVSKVPLIHLFAGAAQSLGAGAILINSWDIAEIASSIGRALNMKDDERRKRHALNFQHVITHTSQKWAEAFVRELADAQSIKGVPPALPVTDAIEHYLQSNNRLLILGFNAVLTEPVDTPGGGGEDQILKLNPELKSTLMELCCDQKTTIVVLSGSSKLVLDNNFSDYNMWLAAENGIFLRPTTGEWETTIPGNLNLDWIDCVKPVFEYFIKRTPKSQFVLRDTSVVWNYKYADVELGRSHAIDLVQHLFTGFSNAPVDVNQGSHSVEVRAVGITKGAGIHRILGEIAGSSDPTQIDYVLCIGHFLEKDEDLYSYFDPELPVETPRTKTSEALKFPGDRMSDLKLQNGGCVSKASHLTSEQPLPNSGKKTSLNVPDLKMENYFSCTVDRTHSRARYSLGSSADVVSLLKALAAASSSS